MMNTSAQDAANVVRRLREFYRPRGEDETFQSIDLNQLVRQSVLLTQHKWKDQAFMSGITLRIETDLQTVPIIAGNGADLREALVNLIFNAVDAMTDTGTITLRTHTDGECVILEVGDTGIGMTEEIRRRCLEPFFSTKGEHGTGLGLAVVYGIIQRHKGEIEIVSEPGRGTTVRIRLPAQVEQQVAASQQPAGIPLTPLHILVVEDEPLVREVVTEYLTGDGHTVETATNGREGLAKFYAGHFDLVMTDKGMPEMSGDQLAAAVKQVAPNKPVILLTGFGDLMNASGEKPVGVDIIVNKPVTLSGLRKALITTMSH
ncbi:response regulator [Candidatus Poribacteria bacterium]|nr:response regulator [Candidatus Poribacteria bacterium]